MAIVMADLEPRRPHATAQISRHLLVERRGEQCRQVSRGPTARVAGLRFREAAVQWRLAVVRRAFELGLG